MQACRTCRKPHCPPWTSEEKANQARAAARLAARHSSLRAGQTSAQAPWRATAAPRSRRSARLSRPSDNTARGSRARAGATTPSGAAGSVCGQRLWRHTPCHTEESGNRTECSNRTSRCRPEAAPASARVPTKMQSRS
eukprot:scaffold1669_cov108-Isochrysis_galbana.AAC.4